MKTKTKRSGISLVDLVIGIALLTIVMLGAFLSLKSLGQGRGGMSVNARVNNKIRTIGEQMRYDAATDKYFTWDQQPTTDWTNTFDSAIQVVSTVETESSATRSRKVTLTATWKDISGATKTRSSVFYINRVRAETPGATVRIRVVKSVNTSVGIPGVKVWVQGKTGMIPPFGQLTDADGRAVISGAIIGSSVPMKVNGEDAKCFHDSPKEWERNFTLSQTSLSQDNGDFDNGGLHGPIQMVAPGQLSGQSYDNSANNPDPAPAGLTVRVFVIASDIAWAPTLVNLSTLTASGGRYLIEKLVPGTYFPLFVGNNLYMAQARPGDRYLSNPNNRDFIRLNSDDSKVLDFRTGHRGSLTGAITQIYFTGGNYTPNGSAPSSVKLSFYRTNAVGYHDPNLMPPSPSMDFTDTTAWTYLYSSSNLESLDTVGGSYTLANFTPWIINADTASFPMSGQYNRVRVEPLRTEQPAPVTPIRAMASGSFPALPANTKFLMVCPSNNTRLTAPYGTDPDLFTDVNVKVNTSPTKTIYLLERSALARVRGTVVIGTGGSEVNFTSATGRIMFNFGGSPQANRAFGGVQWSGGNVNKAYLDYYQSTTTISGTHDFDSFYNSTMPNNLPPNLGSDTTKIYFDAGLATVQSRVFSGPVSGTVKIVDNGNVLRYITMDPADVNATMNVQGYEYRPSGLNVGSCGGMIFQSNNVPIVNGQLGSGGGGFNQNMSRYDKWEGNTTVTLAAGQYINNAKITVNQTVNNNYYDQVIMYFPNFSPDDQWQPNQGWATPGGPVYTYNGTAYVPDTTYAWNTRTLGILHRMRYDVTGTVRAASDNSLINGATIALYDRAGNYWETTTNASGVYTFSARYTAPLMGWNIQVRVKTIPVINNTNYDATDWVQKEFADQMNTTFHWQKDFSLVGSPVDPGNGGGGGGRGN